MMAGGSAVAAPGAITFTPTWVLTHVSQPCSALVQISHDGLIQAAMAVSNRRHQSSRSLSRAT
jgi:hypothetical protein